MYVLELVWIILFKPVDILETVLSIFAGLSWCEVIYLGTLQKKQEFREENKGTQMTKDIGEAQLFLGSGENMFEISPEQSHFCRILASKD